MRKEVTDAVRERIMVIKNRVDEIKPTSGAVDENESMMLFKEFWDITAEYNLFDQVFEVDGKMGVVDIFGNVVVPALYKDYPELYNYTVYTRQPVPACNFVGKYALVKCDGKGTPLCDFEYEMIRFMFGTSAFYMCWKQVGDKLLTGVMDGDGNMLVPCGMDVVYAVSNNIAVIEKDGKFGCITMDKFYLEPVYDEVQDRNGYLYVCKDGAWGYISTKGEFVDENDEDRMDEEELVLLLDY